MCRGLFDSFALHRCLILITKSSKIRMKLVQCVILNGVIFLGSIWLFSYVISPILGYILRWILVPAGVDGVVGVISVWIEWVYYAFWILPVYILSFVLNTLWYQDIATESMRIYPVSVSVPASSSSVTVRIADVLYRLIFNATFLVFLALMYNFRVLYLLYLSFFISFSSFEFRFGSINDKILSIERNWVYYLFFGFPLALIVVQFPSMVENGLISLLFPFLLMTASIGAKPAGIVLPPMRGRFFFLWTERMRILAPVQLVTNIVAWILGRCV